MNYDSFAAYLKSQPENTIFRLWKYIKVFTPYEQHQMFTDQSRFEDDFCEYVIIDDTINLPDGDILLKTHCPSNNPNYYCFYKLSDIQLEQSDKDI